MINKAVSYILSNDTDVAALVGSKIYPVSIPEKTKAPVIAFYSKLIDAQYDKSSSVVDVSETTVVCYAKSYPESATMKEAVRAALEGVKGDFNGVQVIQARVKSGEEDFANDPDIYYQALTFIFKSSKL